MTLMHSLRVLQTKGRLTRDLASTMRRQPPINRELEAALTDLCAAAHRVVKLVPREPAAHLLGACVRVLDLGQTQQANRDYLAELLRKLVK